MSSFDSNFTYKEKNVIIGYTNCYEGIICINFFFFVKMKTIAILIIHGKQLSDNLLDENLKYLADEVTSLNYNVNNVLSIEPRKNLIILELTNLLKQNDFVLLIDKLATSLTFNYLNDIFNLKDDNSIYPKYSKLLKYENFIKLKPVIYFNRIFIIQDLNIKLVFDNILKGYLEQFNREKLFIKKIRLSSFDVINLLDKTGNCVEVKSVIQESIPTIQLQSLDLKKLIDCQKYIQTELSSPCQHDVYYLQDSYSDNEHGFSNIRQATQCIEKCLSDFGLENVFISFNGGKDCTVLLHLVLGIIRKKYPEYNKSVVCLYIQSANPFQEVNQFIDLVQQYYNLEIITIDKGVREGLETFLAVKTNMKACLMGTRRTDPYSENLEIFQMTDPNWPQVMRVSPLLDWHYSEIWDYLLYYQVPYCSLYDEGYTSLGSVNNTIRNPNLLYKTDKDNEIYLPAYKLLDGNTERSGRV